MIHVHEIVYNSGAAPGILRLGVNFSDEGANIRLERYQYWKSPAN